MTYAMVNHGHWIEHGPCRDDTLCSKSLSKLAQTGHPRGRRNTQRLPMFHRACHQHDERSISRLVRFTAVYASEHTPLHNVDLRRRSRSGASSISNPIDCHGSSNKQTCNFDLVAHDALCEGARSCRDSCHNRQSQNNGRPPQKIKRSLHFHSQSHPALHRTDERSATSNTCVIDDMCDPFLNGRIHS